MTPKPLPPRRWLVSSEVSGTPSCFRWPCIERPHRERFQQGISGLAMESDHPCEWPAPPPRLALNCQENNHLDDDDGDFQKQFPVHTLKTAWARFGFA